jgi:AcrR family transcriptional regulator
MRSMREMSFPESGSKRKLLDSAEQLFADKGFEAVSVRDITGLAKTNVAAVNYHFGSREALLGMVMMRYMIPVTQERLARLETLERKWSGKSVPLEEIIEALVRPLITQVRKSELSERLFYKLIGRIFAQQGDQLSAPIEEQLRQVIDRFTRAFAKTLPTLIPEDLVWRMHFMAGGMIHMLTHQDVLNRLTGGSSGAPSMEAILSRFIRFVAAGLREGAATEGPVEEGPQATFDFGVTIICQIFLGIFCGCFCPETGEMVPHFFAC